MGSNNIFSAVQSRLPQRLTTPGVSVGSRSARTSSGTDSATGTVWTPSVSGTASTATGTAATASEEAQSLHARVAEMTTAKETYSYSKNSMDASFNIIQ